MMFRLPVPLLLLLAGSLVLAACNGDDDDSADYFSIDDDDIFADDDDNGPDDDDNGPDDDDSTPDGGNGGPAAKVLGTWIDAGSSVYVIGEDTWTVTDAEGLASSYLVSEFNSTLQYMVGQNSAANPENPELWSRFEWIPATSPDIYLCHRVADGVSETSAGGVSPANPGSPTTGGCNDLPWVLLSPHTP